MQAAQAKLTQQDKHSYSVTGKVDFDTVPALMSVVSDYLSAANASRATGSGETEISIDLSQITDCNSAGLAMMLEIVKLAQASGVSVKYLGVPVTLLTIARAYGIEHEIKDLCSRDVNE